MNPRYRIFNRKGTYYQRNTLTGERISLRTKNREEADRLVDAANQSEANPILGHHLAKAYLNASDPRAMERTWQTVMDEYVKIGGESTRERKGRVFVMKEFGRLRKIPIATTVAEDFYKALETGKVCVNIYLIQLQNFALDMTWLHKPVIPRKRFPKPDAKRDVRAITAEEHALVIQAEKNPERRLYYELLWEVGSSQSDGALLTDDNFDMEKRILTFERQKTDQICRMAMSDRLVEIVRQLPSEGLLFPGLQNGGQNFRASEFRRRRRILKIKGITLHSYRYAWAERAAEAGIPERYAMAALGHGSKAVHRAYARKAKTVCPALPEKPEEPKAAEPKANETAPNVIPFRKKA